MTDDQVLQVIGDSGDTVSLNKEDWESIGKFKSGSELYHEFVSGDARLIVDGAIDIELA